MNFNLVGFYGNRLLSIHLYSHRVVPKESQLLYKSLKGSKMTV
ncbi:hypothetical protein [Chryseobacterium indologenes]|nr:hypothetical protein [Chryseobacterium indologenes]